MTSETEPPALLTAQPTPSQDQVKHLEFIQAVVTRLGNNSFLLKGWCLTLAAGLLAFAAEGSRVSVAVTAFVPLLAFWLLDGYFLWQERLFRNLYDQVRKPAGGGVEPFAMNPRPYAAGTRWRQAACSVTLALFYGGMAVAHLAVLVAVLLA
ncbi:hypothetical protein HUT19_30400 [Streptomyces sp. NA02950]|uniref:hypothetical protein n=1 Tax=Streptomyces sp. NA02950 TaxID=2742137 RepID=UPI00159086B4|nr:hypothetical protein [Streptomyces sp. NA02950]QKV95518.1 hypothetical protein HUT19_30400 [Streptomyces sp. NA02950]